MGRSVINKNQYQSIIDFKHGDPLSSSNLRVLAIIRVEAHLDGAPAPKTILSSVHIFRSSACKIHLFDRSITAIGQF